MGTTTPKPKALECPGCGGSIQLRGFGRSLSAVCIQCLSIIDTTSPSLQILQRFQSRQRVTPLIPLGKRGKLHGDLWEAIGFQCREITVDGEQYQWREYVLFNPYKGFRYLTEYDGHWNDVKAVTAVPEPTTKSGKRAVKYLGEVYRHFQSARASTTFVMGEFPWQVRVGDEVVCEDFISPPRMMSSERDNQEVTWSLGEYISGEQVWKTFELEGVPPAATGIYANQPSPHEGKSSGWGVFWMLLIALAVVMLLSSVLMGQREAFRRGYTFTPGTPGEASFVTPVFELEGRATNVEVQVRTDLDNQWAFFNMALINDTDGQGYDFGREVGYYHGVDSDGSWSEGKKADSVVIPTVPAGRYYLRIEPETERPAEAPLAPAGRTVRYEVVVRRDVPYNPVFWVVPALLVLPPLIQSMRRRGFEARRWAESDHAPGS
jgi:hypothetical protein